MSTSITHTTLQKSLQIFSRNTLNSVTNGFLQATNWATFKVIVLALGNGSSRTICVEI